MTALRILLTLWLCDGSLVGLCYVFVDKDAPRGLQITAGFATALCPPIGLAAALTAVWVL